MPVKTNTPNDPTAMRRRFHVIQGGKKKVAGPESPLSEYQLFERDLLGSLLPVGTAETQLAVSIVQCHWRLNQIREAEAGMFAAAIPENASEGDIAAANSRTFLENSRYFAKMSLYEERVSNLQHRYLERLLKLQQERKAREAEARREAVTILRKAVVEGVTLDPTRSVEQNGFVFSIADLLAQMTRDELLRTARQRRVR